MLYVVDDDLAAHHFADKGALVAQVDVVGVGEAEIHIAAGQDVQRGRRGGGGGNVLGGHEWRRRRQLADVVVEAVDGDADGARVPVQLDLVPAVVVERRRGRGRAPASLRSQVDVLDARVHAHERLAAHQLQIGDHRLIAYVEDDAVGLCGAKGELDGLGGDARQRTVDLVHDALRVVDAYDLAGQRRRDDDARVVRSAATLHLRLVVVLIVLAIKVKVRKATSVLLVVQIVVEVTTHILDAELVTHKLLLMLLLLFDVSVEQRDVIEIVDVGQDELGAVLVGVAVELGAHEYVLVERGPGGARLPLDEHAVEVQRQLFAALPGDAESQRFAEHARRLLLVVDAVEVVVGEERQADEPLGARLVLVDAEEETRLVNVGDELGGDHAGRAVHEQQHLAVLVHALLVVETIDAHDHVLHKAVGALVQIPHAALGLGVVVVVTTGFSGGTR